MICGKRGGNIAERYVILTEKNGGTMIKLLYAVSLLVLIHAGALFVLCGTRWLQGFAPRQNKPEMSIAERYKTLADRSERSSRDVISPLVEQATAYALYLRPPKPPAPVVASRPTVNTQPVYRRPNTTPKFRLLATTYYRSSPEKSLALISEPGKGGHWTKKGEHVGPFVVERVEKGAVFYRDGNELREMKVAMNATAQLRQIKSHISASTQTTKPNLRLLNAPPLSEIE